MTVFVGTSGWTYESWRNRLYAGVPRSRWLEHYLSQFATVELNVTFYRLPPASTFESWRRRSPPGTRFAVKTSRVLTHVDRLREPERHVAPLVERATLLGDRLGPYLVQLPPSRAADEDALRRLLAAFPAGAAVALEVRHDSWFAPSVARRLEAAGAALVWADRAERETAPTWRTAPFGYLRLHEGRGRPRPRYRKERLAWWVGRIASTFASGEDVYVYFNNDTDGAAVCDARAFGALARSAGLVVSSPCGPTIADH
jgi:uncharacterized protein YecE (DUF72 family)